MHSISDVKREDARRLLSAYSDVIKRVHVGRQEIVLQWRTRKALEKHGILVHQLGLLGYESIIHRKGEIEFAHSDAKSRGVSVHTYDARTYDA
jgi:hypothetical protein